MLPTTFKSIATALAVSAVVSPATAGSSGNQSPPGSNNQNFLINYNFETYPVTVRGSTPATTVIIGDYDLLNFNTVLVNETQPVLVGVPCHTAPTCTAFTLNSQFLASLDPGTSSNPTGPAIITANYQYSPISYFDPYAFYYGCADAALNAAAAVPISCNITATGYNANNKQIYSQVFTYKATGATLQQMNLGYFNQGWSGLQVKTLEFTVTNNATTAGIFDNFLATVYGPQNAAINVDF